MAHIRNFKTLAYSEIIDRLKEEFNIEKDKEIAEILNISAASFFNYKKNDTFPYEKVVLACMDKNISLDSIFYKNKPETMDRDSSTTEISEGTTKDGSETNNVIRLLNDNDLYVSLPQFIKQNDNKSIFAFSQNNIIFFINIDKNICDMQDYYILKKNNAYFIRYIEVTVDDTYLIYSINDSGIATDTKFELTKEEFSKFEVLGTVIKKLALQG